MSISDEISRLSGNISDSFGAVEDMGGTVPQNTNSDNLAAAIRSIPQPDTVTPESIAIVANGNTHGAITSGQYVYVRGHATLAEGLYTAKSAIAVNETLSGANLTAVSGGGLNKVHAELADMNTDIGTRLKRIAMFGGVNAGTYTYALPGNGFYAVFIRKNNASGDGTQGLYLISANASMSRLQVTPVLTLGGSMSLTGAYVDEVPTLTLNTSNQTYINATIVNISA